MELLGSLLASVSLPFHNSVFSEIPDPVSLANNRRGNVTTLINNGLLRDFWFVVLLPPSTLLNDLIGQNLTHLFPPLYLLASFWVRKKFLSTNCSFSISNEINKIIGQRACVHPDRDLQFDWNEKKWFLPDSATRLQKCPLLCLFLRHDSKKPSRPKRVTAIDAFKHVQTRSGFHRRPRERPSDWKQSGAVPGDTG